MKVLILGGGITGLSAAYYLPKGAQITLLEGSHRLGGWIRSSLEGGFFFEKGPRTFQLGRSAHILELIRDLGLEILSSGPQKRYIYTNGKLRSLGSFLPGLIPYLIREPFIPLSKTDESIYAFASRRFSPRIAEALFDPMTLGIYAGDIRKLSVRCCFPSLCKKSIVRTLFSAPKQPKGLFTVKGGMETLIQTLQNRLPVNFVLNCPVEKIEENRVFAGGKVWEADKIISALPPALPANSIWVVNLAYKGDVLRKKGFGYLVPTKEKQSVLGMVFDSCIFPEQNTQGETRITAMIRSEEPNPLTAALIAAQDHLHISAAPIYSSSFFAKNAIPQFEVGCTYPYGISVDACIKRGKELCGP